MSEFKCSVCQKIFKRKHCLDYHINNLVCSKKKYDCRYCMNKFSSKNAMYKHMRDVCKIKKKEDNKKDEIYARLIHLEENNKKIENENKRLKRDMKNMKKQIKCGKMVNNNSVVNVNNGIINNITLVAYGNEDISKLDKKDIFKIFQNGYNSTLKLTETLHFNPKYPEYQNIYITNMKDKYAMMYDGNKWTLTMKEELIDKIYDNKRNYIEDNMNDFLETLTRSQKRSLNRWLDTDEDDKKIKDVKEKIKLLLYNLKHMPLNTDKGDNRLNLNNDIKIIVEEKLSKGL